MRRFTLVDALFFICYDEFTGKPVLSRTMLDVGLVGAVLCDLLLTRRIIIENKKIRPAAKPHRGPAVADRILADIVTEQGTYTLREWIDYLRQDILDLVSAPLIAAGEVIGRVDRSLLRKVQRYRPTDVLACTAARGEVRAVVLGQVELDLYAACLALLSWTVGLDNLCEPELNRGQLRSWMDSTLKSMPSQVADLISGVEATAAAAVYIGNRR
jgi:hypothetical protein